MDRDQDVSRYPVPERVILSAQLGLDRQSYQALEKALIDILWDEAYPFTQRVLAAFVLVDAAVIEYGRGSKSVSAFSVWLDHMLSPDKLEWIYREAAGKRKVNPLNRRRLLAPVICAQEARGARESGGRGPGGLGCALAIARGRGRLFLPSLSTEVSLDAMERLDLDPDLVRLVPILVDYLVDCIRRGLLVRHSNVLKGMRFLLVKLALVRWYAAAVATAHGGDRVGESEVREAVAIMNSLYPCAAPGTGPASEDARYSLLVRALVDVSSPADLVLAAPARS